jgi:hypothetical protein
VPYFRAGRVEEREALHPTSKKIPVHPGERQPPKEKKVLCYKFYNSEMVSPTKCNDSYPGFPTTGETNGDGFLYTDHGGGYRTY